MDMEHMHEVYRLPMPAAPGVPISEFNHHVAGAIILIVGIAALLMYARPRTFALLRYVWPMALLFLGVYLVLYSDPDGWPATHVGLIESVRMDPSALQHKVFSVLLVIMGTIELARASRVARGSAWKWAFPILATLGALYLLVHKHNVSEHMSMPHMTQEMARVRMQHMLYLTLGVGIAASKVVNDLRVVQSRWIGYVWPSLTVLLGIALILYKE